MLTDKRAKSQIPTGFPRNNPQADGMPDGGRDIPQNPHACVGERKQRYDEGSNRAGQKQNATRCLHVCEAHERTREQVDRPGRAARTVNALGHAQHYTEMVGRTVTFASVARSVQRLT